MKKIIGIGNALVDVLVKMSNDDLLTNNNLPKGSMQLVDIETAKKLGEQMQNMEKSIVSGGSAANTIYGLACLGVPTAFVGKVCDDEFGNRYTADMQSYGIMPKMIKGNSLSGFCTALISPDSERTFATFLGAASELKATEITDDLFAGYDILHIEGYLLQDHQLILTAIEKAKKMGLEVSLDLASYNVVEDNLAFLKEIVEKYVDILFANQEESFAFTQLEPQEALAAMAKQVKIAIVKVGADGSYVQMGDKVVKVDAFEAKRVDTTGAGDLYASGFLYGYANNAHLALSATYGSLLSSAVVEVIGPKFSKEKWSALKQEIKNL